MEDRRKRKIEDRRKKIGDRRERQKKIIAKRK